MRIALVILTAIFLLGCSIFTVEFREIPTENGGSEIVLTKVVSKGAFGLWRRDEFTIQKKIDENGAVEYWVRRNTEENPQGQIEMLRMIIDLAQKAALASPLSVQSIE